MSKVSMILLATMTVALTIVIAPGIFAFNRGKVLRNIALWLAIFTGLALIYRNFGPESEHPLFLLPPGMVRPTPAAIPNNTTHTAKPDDDKINGSQNYLSPTE